MNSISPYSSAGTAKNTTFPSKEPFISSLDKASAAPIIPANWLWWPHAWQAPVSLSAQGLLGDTT